MIFYIIFFTSLYASLSAAAAYGFFKNWFWPWILIVVFAAAFIIGVAFHLVYCWFIGLFVNVNKPVKRQNRYFYYLLVQTAYLVLRILRVRIDFKGKEFLPKNSKFLLVCNHISWIDPAVAVVLLKKHHLAFISKKENYDLPIAGPFLHETACLGIDRENNREALKTINNAAELLNNNACAIGIYPEGWVSKTGELLEFRHGAFRIAKKAECPIVVTYIENTDKIFKKPPWKKCTVTFTVKGIIPAEFIKENKTAEISGLAREIMTK